MTGEAITWPAGIRPLPNYDWSEIGQQLDAQGWAVLEDLVAPATCDTWSRMYANEPLFRKRVVMARYGYGQGEYQYFNYPLPDAVASLRAAFYPYLAPVANQWYEKLKLAPRFPRLHQDFLDRCHQAGQTRPTPLMLRYTAGDFNCLHQDLYGEHLFPLQVVFLLSQPGVDFSGGEFVMTQQRARRQSTAEVLPLKKGSAAIFCVRERPIMGAKNYVKVTMRHGVSRLRSGQRTTMGIIFHDAA